MKKKQTVRDVLDKHSGNVLKITANGLVLDSRTMDYEAQIFDELLDLRVRSVRNGNTCGLPHLKIIPEE